MDLFVLSCELGVQKPDPEIFRIAPDMLGTTAESILMVGDVKSLVGAPARQP